MGTFKRNSLIKKTLHEMNHTGFLLLFPLLTSVFLEFNSFSSLFLMSTLSVPGKGQYLPKIINNYYN
jgi:hypothetical protein